MEKAIFCWSGGKDSAYCLYKVINEKMYDIKYLLTTIEDQSKRISMHGISEDLLDLQVESIGIPLLKVRMSGKTDNEYETQMEKVLIKVKSEGIDHVIFGDIFLEDLRLYRENNLSKVGMKAAFPIWKMDTKFLLTDFVSKQFKSIICCTNDKYLGKEWTGREIDRSFIEQLPLSLDPCGENGEYHSFCYEGPIFKKKFKFSNGKKVFKPYVNQIENDYSLPVLESTKGFWFLDLLPAY